MLAEAGHGGRRPAQNHAGPVGLSRWEAAHTCSWNRRPQPSSKCAASLRDLIRFL